MCENNVEEIICAIESRLHSSMGKIVDYELCRQERLTFSKNWKIKLNFKDTTKTVFVKKYLGEKRAQDGLANLAEKEFQILEYLYKKFLALKEINVIKPITFLPAKNILVTEEFAGTRLNVLIVDHIRWLPSSRNKKQIQDYCFQSGKWLKHFQDFTEKDEVTFLKKTPYLQSISEKLVSSKRYGFKDTLHKAIYRFVDSRFSKIGNEKLNLVGYHSDFTPWNILAGHNKIAVLDFDRFSQRNRYNDLTVFLSALEGNKSTVGMMSNNIDMLKDAFLKGYDADKLNPDILDLLLLKNTLKALNAIDIFAHANTGFLDVAYERYRKQRQVKVYLHYVERLVASAL